TLYRQILQTRRSHLAALRGLRDLAAAAGRWAEALDLEQRIVDAVTPAERSPETEWLAVIHYELGRAELARGRPAAGLVHLRNAVRTDRTFLPAALALGDAYEGAGDRREAVRAPALPVVHAYLGAVFERRGETRAAFDEYRRALQLGHAFDWPHQCAGCGATSALWQDRCPSCHRWNTLRPVRG